MGVGKAKEFEGTQDLEEFSQSAVRLTIYRIQNDDGCSEGVDLGHIDIIETLLPS